MKISLILVLLTGMVSTLLTSACQNAVRSETSAPQVASAEQIQGPTSVANDEIFDGKEIVRPEKEWRARLTPDEYHILREAGTEPPYKNEYADNHEHGTYYCRACHLKLFTSETKFESGTGWPSFYQPFNKKNVIEKTDSSYGMDRTEVLCARCRSHLGHVFDDGPKPTGLRYCMNSASLKFERN